MLAGGVVCVISALLLSQESHLTPVPTLTSTPTRKPLAISTLTQTLIVTPTSPPAATPTPTVTPTSTATPMPTPTPRRLPTGTIIKDSPRNGYGELVIKNELNNQDAVAVLTPIGSKTPLIAIYIRAGDFFPIKGIEDGSYDLYFSLGEDWDDQQGQFTRKASPQRFVEPLSFQTVPVTGGVQYTSITVTLYKVITGTTETTPVPEEEFPGLRP